MSSFVNMRLTHSCGWRLFISRRDDVVASHTSPSVYPLVTQLMMWSHWRSKGNIHSRGYRLLLGPAKWNHVEPTVKAQRATHKPVTPETMLKRSSTSNGRRTHVHKHSGDIVTPKMKEIAAGVQAGERSRLAEAITLVESKHPVKHKQAQWLLTKVLSHQSKQQQLGTLKQTLRIGLSGPPGAGKSTLIDGFGKLLTNQGYRVAVLAVDPSSSLTGGSILADKTRMAQLTKDPKAFIRPSPSGGRLGGVNRSMNEAIILCEGAGYDVVIVETVGVGQSETAVCDMVDMFVLITPPAAGDELQGMKKGIVELADMIVVNKADGDLLPAARRIKTEYVSALKLIRTRSPYWVPKVVMVSSITGDGIEEMWKTMQNYIERMKEVEEFDAKRKTQRKHWLWNHIDWQLRHRFQSHPGMAAHITAMETRVMAGSLAPSTASDILLDEFMLSTRTDTTCIQ